MRNWGGLGGVLYVGAMIGVFAYLGDGAGETAEAARDYYADINAVFLHMLIVAAAAGLVWFASALHRVIGSCVATASHVAGAMGILVCGAVLMAPSEANEMDAFSNDPSLIEVFDNLAYFLLTHSHALIGLAAIAAGVAMRRSTIVPAWLALVAIVLGVLGLASAAFIPMLAIWLYLVIVGVWLVVARPEADPIARPVSDGVAR